VRRVGYLPELYEDARSENYKILKTLVEYENKESRLVTKPFAQDKAPLGAYLQMFDMQLFPWLPCRCPNDSPNSFHISAAYLTPPYLSLL